MISTYTYFISIILFIQLYKILLCRRTRLFHLFIRLWAFQLPAFFEVLWKVLQKTWEYRFTAHQHSEFSFLGYIQALGLLDQMAVLSPSFEEFRLLSTLVVLIYIPTSICKSSLFSMSLPPLVNYCIFENSHSYLIRCYLVFFDWYFHDDI